MESLSLSAFLQVASSFGPLGVIMLLWWWDQRRIQTILDQYARDQAENRKFYENNVILVEGFKDLTARFAKSADDYSSSINMYAIAITRLTDSIVTNQYCPEHRLEKQATGKVVG